MNIISNSQKVFIIKNAASFLASKRKFKMIINESKKRVNTEHFAIHYKYNINLSTFMEKNKFVYFFSIYHSEHKYSEYHKLYIIIL